LGRRDEVLELGEAVGVVEDALLVREEGVRRVLLGLADAVADRIVAVGDDTALGVGRVHRVGDGGEAVEVVVGVAGRLGLAGVDLDLGSAVAVRVIAVGVAADRRRAPGVRERDEAIGLVVLVRRHHAVRVGDGVQEVVRPVGVPVVARPRSEAGRGGLGRFWPPYVYW
jgi:hypothetical protein